MKNAILIILFLSVTACKKKPHPVPSGGGAYDNVVRTITNGGAGVDISRSLNDLMSGPTNGMNCNGSPRGNSQEPRSSKFTMGRRASSASSIKGEKQVYWNECAGTMTANYAERKRGKLNHYKCSKRRAISEKYINYFEKNFPKCVKQGFKKAQGANSFGLVGKITFTHEGVAGDQRHSNGSYHSINRAMDVAVINVESNGKKYSFDVKNQKRGLEQKFFTEFRQCWHDSLVATSDKCPGSFPKGTIGHEDKHHQNHMHISLPFCPGRSGYYSKIAHYSHGSHESAQVAMESK